MLKKVSPNSQSAEVPTDIAKSSGMSTMQRGQTFPNPVPKGLHYVHDDRPGFTRHANGDGFSYRDVDGNEIEDADVVARINALAIPPAYVDVWICPDSKGHLQATGKDARGRKQYRYHPLWRETRDATKYERMLAFGAALPKIRRRVTRDLGLRGMPRDKVLATVVRLLDTTLIRIGNSDYARDNHSFGLTTLRTRHVKFEKGTLRFQFRGKSGVQHDVAVTDRRVAGIVKKCFDLPGHELFQYLDDDGARHTVDSAAINDYLRACSGGDFTAKDYRTWAGTVFALAALCAKPCENPTQARREVVATVKEISRRLGNTPAVCRRCYVHPAVIDAYQAGGLLADAKGPHAFKQTAIRPLAGLRQEEARLSAFLKAIIGRDTPESSRRALRVR
jgi:DNA topoisomerase-1